MPIKACEYHPTRRENQQNRPFPAHGERFESIVPVGRHSQIF